MFYGKTFEIPSQCNKVSVSNVCNGKSVKWAIESRMKTATVENLCFNVATTNFIKHAIQKKYKLSLLNNESSSTKISFGMRIF